VPTLIIERISIFEVNVTPQPTPRIMITEDDREVNSLIAAVFRLNGYDAFMALKAEECLAELNELDGEVDVVYMNGKIAEDKGAMLISKIKQINYDIKILVVANDESSKSMILEYGADDFIMKPVNIETIFSKVIMLVIRKK
jgi:DNA-binding response OmpR family regulator